jgi:hypothetical protein
MGEGPRPPETPALEEGPPGRHKRIPAGRWSPRVALGLVALLLVYGSITAAATRHTSATFDEILLSAAGARGYETGDFDLVHLYHPRLLPYLYGLPVFFSRPNFPPEAVGWGDRPGFPYARALFFASDNPTQLLLSRSRLVAVGLGMLLISLVFVFLHRYYGSPTAFLGAGLTAFLPDVLAHGGIAYNDIPAAAVFFAAVWALDSAIRSGTVPRAVLASVLVALALNTKFSSLLLGPVAVVLLGLELLRRRRDRSRFLLRSCWLLLLGTGIIYLGAVAVHLGDFRLESFRVGLASNIAYAASGGAQPPWLLGRLHPGGVWYFYPVAFLIKTPVAFHALCLLSLGAFVASRPSWSPFLESPLRGPAVAGVVVLASLLTSNLQIGFRHASPLLPFLVVGVAVGCMSAAQRWGRGAALATATLAMLHTASALSWYPHFLPYVSEYSGDRDRGHRLISDSSHDWGQGLVELGRFMDEEGIPSIYLSYFGSAHPTAYGVRYVPLPSFYSLPDPPIASEPPRYVAISATNLAGGYVDEAFAHFRDREPYRVLGHTVFVFEVNGPPIPP